MPAHVTAAQEFPRFERDDEKQIAAEQRNEKGEERRILVRFRLEDERKSPSR